MIRHAAVPAAFLALLASAACTPTPLTGGPAAATSAGPALVAPSPTDGGAARKLLERYAVTGRFVGLTENPAYAEEKLDSDGVVCGRPLPLLDRRLIRVTHVFDTPKSTAREEFAEVYQETVVYPDEAVAAEGLRQLFDLLERCGEDVEEGQVTTGHAAAELPAAVGLPGRAVAATMTLPDGTPFPHRYGCVHRGRVMQCVAVWTRSEPATATWFEKAITATGDGLIA